MAGKGFYDYPRGATGGVPSPEVAAMLDAVRAELDVTPRRVAPKTWSMQSFIRCSKRSRWSTSGTGLDTWRLTLHQTANRKSYWNCSSDENATVCSTSSSPDVTRADQASP